MASSHFPTTLKVWPLIDMPHVAQRTSHDVGAVAAVAETANYNRNDSRSGEETEIKRSRKPPPPLFDSGTFTVRLIIEKTRDFRHDVLTGTRISFLIVVMWRWCALNSTSRKKTL